MSLDDASTRDPGADLYRFCRPMVLRLMYLQGVAERQKIPAIIRDSFSIQGCSFILFY